MQRSLPKNAAWQSFWITKWVTNRWTRSRTVIFKPSFTSGRWATWRSWICTSGTTVIYNTDYIYKITTHLNKTQVEKKLEVQFFNKFSEQKKYISWKTMPIKFLSFDAFLKIKATERENAQTRCSSTKKNVQLKRKKKNKQLANRRTWTSMVLNFYACTLSQMADSKRFLRHQQQRNLLSDISGTLKKHPTGVPLLW